MLQESHFGFGVTHDTLVIEPHDFALNYVELSVTMIQAFVEAVLGYRAVGRPGGGWDGPWELIREKGFK